MKLETDRDFLSILGFDEIEPAGFAVFRMTGNVKVAGRHFTARLVVPGLGGDELSNGQLGTESDPVILDIRRHKNRDSNGEWLERAWREACWLMLLSHLHPDLLARLRGDARCAEEINALELINLREVVGNIRLGRLDKLRFDGDLLAGDKRRWKKRQNWVKEEGLSLIHI